MGVYRRILRTLKARTNQADKPSAKSVPELFNEARDALWEIEAENRDLDITQPILDMDKLLRASEAKWDISHCQVCGEPRTPHKYHECAAITKTDERVTTAASPDDPSQVEGKKNATAKPHHHKEG